MQPQGHMQPKMCTLFGNLPAGLAACLAGARLQHHRFSTVARTHPLKPVRRSTSVHLMAVLLMAIATAAQPQSAAIAQGWQTNVDPAPANPSVSPNVTVIPRTPPPSANNPDTATDPQTGLVRLSALLTDNGQRIERDLVWRVYRPSSDGRQQPQLLVTRRDAYPNIRLKAGEYIINAAFGRAHLTRRITVAGGQEADEQFVINAGGLRLTALVDGDKPPATAVSYQIFEGERDQSGNRRAVMLRARPGLIIRLNAGIYHIVSTYGDANARVRADITVEAGKLTEATISHAAGKVAFKLVDQPGGEALPGTKWTIRTEQGDLVKQSVGALPSHVLAPGRYTVSANSFGKTYEKTFSVENGQMASVEVLRQ